MNTSVVRFLEAASLVVPLFLTTRVCALAAPVLGRTVSRWMLAAGIPAILVCALAGAAVLDRWPAEVEAVLATGLLVSLLLCLVWIPALLVKAGRWAFRRGRAAPTAPGPPRIFEGFRLAGALTAVVVAVVFVQWGFYRDESRTEVSRYDSMRTMVGALAVEKKKGEEFNREASALEASWTRWARSSRTPWACLDSWTSTSSCADGTASRSRAGGYARSLESPSYARTSISSSRDHRSG